MHRSPSHSSALVIGAAVLAGCASRPERAAVGEPSAAQRAAVAQRAPAAMPDSRFRGGGFGEQFYASDDGRLAMRVSHDMEARQVRISHRHFHDVEARAARMVDTSERVEFWPTQTAKYSNGRLCVAGFDPRSGNTILEIWTVSAPRWVSGYAARMAAKVEPGVVTERWRVYDAFAPGMNTVQRVHAMRSTSGTPSHLLVQFHDSHDVHTLEVATGKTKRVASAIEHADGATIPLLARELVSQSRRHRTEGALYVLSETNGSESQPSVVVLRDADLDGSIDSTSVMSLEAFREAGYLTSEAWID